MILTAFGTLSVAQTITNSNEISENVIEYTPDSSGVDYSAMTDIWWIVSTSVIATGDGSDSYKFALVMATSAGLGSSIEVCSVLIEDKLDLRVATVGRFIAAFNIGKMLKQALETDGSGYEFIGMKNTLTAGSTISIDAELSPTEPHTIHHKMATESNVTTPVLASVISGFKT